MPTRRHCRLVDQYYSAAPKAKLRRVCDEAINKTKYKVPEGHQWSKQQEKERERKKKKSC